jgi:hypothetical protein
MAFEQPQMLMSALKNPAALVKKHQPKQAGVFSHQR